MTKNRKFKNVYVVTVEGTCTNGFNAKIFDTMIKQYALAMNYQQQQVNVSLEVKSTSGDFDAINGTIDS